ncbi:MAG: PA0069 family radical SAM protein [Verrucomicrobiales bacterium]
MPNFINDRGRGTVEAPPNRFEKLTFESDDAAWEEISKIDPDFENERPRTEVFRDDSQSIISKNSSPDLGFDASLNPYRGCEHGCAYCYARPSHEYLGMNAGLDFESKIMAKLNAPDLLEREISAGKWIPQNLACSGVTDCYQPIERKFKITRGCLEVLSRARHPVGIVTKNALVTRDIDLLSELAHYNCSAVSISLTSLDADVAAKLEPRASHPNARLRAIRELSEAGIPVGVSTAPIVPGLNDHEIPALLEAAADHGASFASFTVVRLPYAVKDIFTSWLERFFPDRKELILGRIREMRGGKLNESDFATRMRGDGIVAEQIAQLFTVSSARAGLNRGRVKLSTDHFRKLMPGGQGELF